MERGRGFWFLVVLAGAGLAARATLFETWTVPDELGGAAEPTLSTGDVVLVGKRAGGGFGDLVRCTTTTDARPAIGRIVGLAGDVVETQGANLSVNGRSYEASGACPNPRVTVESPRIPRPVDIDCEKVEMGHGWHYRGSGGSLYGQDRASTRVPAESAFLLSDDRMFHDDSRDFGPVKAETCHPIYFRMRGKRGYQDDERRFVVIH